MKFLCIFVVFIVLFKDFILTNCKLSDAGFQKREKEHRVRERRAFARNGTAWRKINGKLIIPYTIQFQENTWQYQTIMMAIKKINSQIRCNRNAWRPRKNERSYVVFQTSASQSCSSNVGQVSVNFPQPINLPDWCIASGALYHEMMHAMGFWHELDRPDRHKFIDINWKNIRNDKIKKFKRMKPDNPLGPFGYSSIMMVHEYAYSKNKRKLLTITAKNPRDQWKLKHVVRSKPGLSTLDVKMLNKFYHCDNKYDSYFADNWSSKGGCKEYEWCKVALRVQPHSCEIKKWYQTCSITCKKCKPKKKSSLRSIIKWDKKKMKNMETKALQAKSIHQDFLTPRLRIAFYFIVQNKHHQDVDILWKDFDGNEVFYKRLRPSWTLVQLTYATHPWIARDSRWKNLLTFTKDDKTVRDVIFEGFVFGITYPYEFIKVSITNKRR